MDNVVKKLTPVSKLIAIIALYAATAFAFIANAAGIGGGFFPVVGGLIGLLFATALFGSIPTLLLLKKDKLANFALIPVFSYWFINSVFDALGWADNAVSGAGGLTITIGIFAFIVALALLTAGAFGVLYFLKKDKKFLQLAIVILFGTILFFFLIWVLLIALFAKYGWDWNSYFDAFYQYLFLPIGISFLVLDRIQAVVYGTSCDNSAPASSDNRSAENDNESVVADESVEEEYFENDKNGSEEETTTDDLSDEGTADDNVENSSSDEPADNSSFDDLKGSDDWKF